MFSRQIGDFLFQFPALAVQSNLVQQIPDPALRPELLDKSIVVIFLFKLDWKLACASLITLPLYGLAIVDLNPRMRQAAKERAHHKTDATKQAGAADDGGGDDV